ncbi:hypothetical protein PDESU_04964 [Pontiella desulfatans]|uniref:Right handed beta helix domain-containing protein n=1 Tax=Pontiella desulfatans TaxID=2750659 RepID=A0A6C2U946_PONDE|nr:hypothetical protein [Pontiella desulfatans]VGO16373.1 hypothetical protein PDESU_04964 [Pontiella desulfatans]
MKNFFWIGAVMVPLFCGAAKWRVNPQNVNEIIAKARAGDTVYFEAGRYADPVEFEKLKGKPDAPITITAAPGAGVVFDGTDELSNDWKKVTPDSAEGQRIQGAQWERIKTPVYSLKLAEPIHALLYEGRLMSDARWPNARWDDPWRLDRYMVLRRADVGSEKGRLLDGLPTENTLEESEKWIHYDRSQLTHRDEMLADTGISFKDAVVLMSHTWGSWATRVTGHEAGDNVLEYDTSFNGSGSIQSEAKGFLNNRIGWGRGTKKFEKSGHAGIHFSMWGLPALDIEEEWWYDAPTKTLYFIPPNGKKPAPGSVRGKRRDYLLTASACSNLIIKGFKFYGSAALLNECTDSRLEDCAFITGSYNKFSVANFDMPVTTRIYNRGSKVMHGNTLLNCSFTYCDGNAFEGRSAGLSIDNVLIKHTQQTTLGLDSRSMSINRPLLVRRVTIEDVGASVGIKGGGIDSVYELNNISRFGGLQYDGASLQMGGREKFIYRYNWSHDHPKRSYRFDAGSYPDFANAFGEMSYNVAWNTPGGFALKGDDLLLHNNTLIGGGFELFNMKRWASKNERTVVANNIVQYMSAGNYDWDKPAVKKSTTENKLITDEDYWLKETKVPDTHPTLIGKNGGEFDDGHARGPKKSPVLAILKNNVLEEPSSMLRDPSNLDFRPKTGSALIGGGVKLTENDVLWKEVPFTGSNAWKKRAPSVGAYEAGAQVYWIPGYKFSHASTPVPPDGTVTARPDCGLMWLGGYLADTHHLFVGTSAEVVERAEKLDPAYRGSFKDERNVYAFNKALPAGTQVFWRVDAERDGTLVKGPVWHFSVK